MSVDKSSSDSRDYHYFELPNKMKCLVISDPETDVAVTAVDVNVGCQSDPRNTAGLAHLLERMLLSLGTEKYPVENYYSSFLSKNAGWANTNTWTEDTRFYFKVSSDKLEQALDIFSQFFISPLFTKDAVDRVVKIVDSEFRKSLKDDFERINHLSINTALDWHSYKRFRNGNMETLNKPDIYDQVKEFYSTKYSSNLMTIVVYGKESLYTLENWVRQNFAEVVNKNLIPETDTRMPYDETVTGTLCKVKTIQNLKELSFFWYWPPDMMHYKSRPGEYIAYLLGHQGKNSLFSFLKAEGLVQELYSDGLFGKFLNYSDLQLTIELTDKGVKNYESVIEIIHAYIAILKEKGIQEWIYEEIKAIWQNDFNFKSKDDLMSYCKDLSLNLHRYPYEKVLTVDNLIEEYKPDVIKYFMDHITPQNLQVYFCSRKFDESQMQTEKWYETKYSIERFSNDLLEKMNNPQVYHPKLVLDIPLENSPIIVFENLPSSEKSLPSMILDNEKNTVWHSQDNSYNMEKVYSQLRIYCNDAGFQDSVYFYMLGKIWCDIFWDKFREENNLAKRDGLSLSLDIDNLGLNISLSGNSQKYGKFFENVIKSLVTVVIDNNDKELFQSHYTNINSSLNNHFYGSKTWNQAFSIACELMHLSGYYSETEKLKALRNITFEDLLWFHSKWLKTVRFEWFVIGNYSVERTIYMVESCTSIFEQAKNCAYIRKDDYPISCITEIPRTPCNTSVSTLVYPTYLIDRTNNNSVSYCLWQCGDAIFKSEALLKILNNFLEVPCYDTLCTKEQLGYIVWSLVRQFKEVLHFAICVQSSVVAPYFLTDRISNFINEIKNKVIELSDEKFNAVKESTIESFVKKDISIYEKYNRFIPEVNSRAYLFTRSEDIEAELRNVTKEEFQRFFEELFFENARRLDIELISENMRESQESATRNREVIKTSNDFKRRMREFRY